MPAGSGKIIFDLGTTCLLSWALLLTTTLVYFCGKNSPCLLWQSYFLGFFWCPTRHKFALKKPNYRHLGRFIWIHRNFLAYLSSWVFKTEKLKNLLNQIYDFSVWKCSFFKNQKILMSNKKFVYQNRPSKSKQCKIPSDGVPIDSGGGIIIWNPWSNKRDAI